MRKTLCLGMTALGLFGITTALVHAEPPKNIVFCIGDGMGFNHVKAAHDYIGTNLIFETFPNQATVMTYAANSAIPDSASAGTAMATGHKVDTGVISIAQPGDGHSYQTILEYLKAHGKRTALLTTDQITEATPATYGAHVSSRTMYAQIAAHYLTNSHPNVVFGGGDASLNRTASTNAGYAYVTNAATLADVDAATNAFVMGSFGTGALPYVYVGRGALPGLTNMVEKALGILSNGTNGFFMMMEGNGDDDMAHANNISGMVREDAEFNQSVQMVLDWASNRNDTLVIVTADHETGGLTNVIDNGAGVVPSGTWTTTGHTANRVPAYGWGPGAEFINGVTNNTDYFPALVAMFTFSNTVTSVPTGLTVTVDDVTNTTPYTFLCQGASAIMQAASPQTNAAPDTRYVFDAWTNADSGVASADNPFTFAVTGHTQWTALFRTQYRQTYACAPTNGGAVNPATFWADDGAAVTVTVTTASGFAFTGWRELSSSNIVSTGTSYIYSATAPAAFTAEFEPAPLPVTHLTATSGTTSIELSWTNSGSDSFTGVLILRRADYAPTSGPEQAREYQPGDLAGDADVVYTGPGADSTAGALSGWSDTNVTEGVGYYYRVFAFNRYFNYSQAASAAAAFKTMANIRRVVPNPDDHYFQFTWQNPDEPDFQGVLVLRGESGGATNMPVNGQDYTTNDMVGGSEVVYSGPASNATANEASGWSDPAEFPSLTSRYYTFHAYDSLKKYARPAVIVKSTTLPGTNTPADVTGLAAANVAENVLLSWTNPVDEKFREVLVARMPDPIHWRPVNGSTYASGSWKERMYIAYAGPGSSNAPGAASQITDGHVEADTPYHYRVFTVSGIKIYSPGVDVTLHSWMPDTNAPADVTGLSATPLPNCVMLSWTNPADADLSGLLVVRSTEGISWHPASGMTYTPGTEASSVYVVHAGQATPGQPGTITDSQGIADGTSYYYRVFCFDKMKNYSGGADATALMPAIGKLYVKASATGLNSGTTWDDACTNLQTALASWTNSQQLWVAEGVYYPGTNSTNQFSLRANMALYGGFAGNETTLAQRKWQEHPTSLNGNIGNASNTTDNSQHVVIVPATATNSLLDGFIIENGYNTSGYGSGIYIAAPMLVQNCIIQTNYNSGGGGGGMHVDQIKVTVRNTIFRGNHGTYRGGGLQVYAGWGQNPIFENCLFYDNVQDTAGGAMALFHGPTTFRNCAFINNSALNGSGVYITNYGEPWFYNCILWDTGDQGCGVWAKKWNGSNESGPLYFYNCIMRENFIPPDPAHNINSYLGAKVNCMIGQNPQFVDATNKDFHLQATSPALNAAVATNAPVDDLDGNLRPASTNTDIGPYELNIKTVVPLLPAVMYMLK